MIGAVARLLGVDPVQWRALVQVSLLVDVRQRRDGGLGLARTAVGSFGGVLLTQLLYGALAAALIATVPDTFAASTLYYLLLMSTIGMALLVDFTGIVLSPDDHVQLAPRPVDDRTFFVARLTSVLIFSLALAVPLAVPAAFGYLFAPSGGSASMAITSLGAAAMAAVLVPLVVIHLFLVLARLLPLSRLHQGLGYVQFVLSFAFMGGFFLLVRSPRALDAVTVGKVPLAYLNPASWFAAWVEVAAGRATTVDVMSAGVPIALLLLSALLVRTRLSLAWAERLASTSVAGRATARAGRPVPTLIVGPAHHAVALLAKAQFRTDQKFRLGVLGILPLTVIYLLAGVSDGEGPEGAAREPVLVYYAVLFFPVMLRQFLVYSESWRASWVFHVAPMPFAEVVVGLKNTVVARFLVPYLALVVLLLGWTYPRPPLELLMHGLVVGLISHALLTADLLVHPSLPFSRPPRTGTGSIALIALMVPTMIVISTIPLWRAYLYASIPRTFAFVAVLVVLNVLLHESLLTRVDRLSRQWACPQ